MLIDTHCHLDRFFFKGEFDRILEAAATAGVGRMITVGTTMADWSLYAELASQMPSRLAYSVGLHPGHVGEDWPLQVAELRAYWQRENPPAALGEIGLDFFHLPKDAAERQRAVTRQRAALAAQLEIARDLDCPVIIHSRNAVEAVTEMIDASGANWSRFVFHCFSDGPQTLEPVLQRGGRASFTGILTFRRADDVRAAARLQGLDRLMLETDAPYLAPEPHRGEVCQPAFVRHTAERAAALFDLPLEELAALTTRNATAFFGLPEAPASPMTSANPVGTSTTGATSGTDVASRPEGTSGPDASSTTDATPAQPREVGAPPPGADSNG